MLVTALGPCVVGCCWLVVSLRTIINYYELSMLLRDVAVVATRCLCSVVHCCGVEMRKNEEDCRRMRKNEENRAIAKIILSTLKGNIYELTHLLPMLSVKPPRVYSDTLSKVCVLEDQTGSMS